MDSKPAKVDDRAVETEYRDSLGQLYFNLTGKVPKTESDDDKTLIEALTLYDEPCMSY